VYITAVLENRRIGTGLKCSLSPYKMSFVKNRWYNARLVMRISRVMPGVKNAPVSRNRVFFIIKDESMEK
jgi:hypothetical protein